VSITPTRLLLMACTATKLATPDSIPAIQRYDGPSFRVLRKWQRTHPDLAVQLDVLILSARLGLISSDQLIENYNQRLTREHAAVLQPIVGPALQRFIAEHGPYTSTLLHLGRDYLPAIAPEAVPSELFGTVMHTSGGIGMQLRHLKTWLYAAAPG
jgi:Family of unknown function (DUF6884)